MPQLKLRIWKARGKKHVVQVALLNILDTAHCDTIIHGLEHPAWIPLKVTKRGTLWGSSFYIDESQYQRLCRGFCMMCPYEGVTLYYDLKKYYVLYQGVIEYTFHQYGERVWVHFIVPDDITSPKMWAGRGKENIDFAKMAWTVKQQ
jgi:hypothetical protein